MESLGGIVGGLRAGHDLSERNDRLMAAEQGLAMTKSKSPNKTTVPIAPADAETASARAPAPLTITRPALLVDGTDQRFRELLGNLMTMGRQLQELRAGLARRLGVSEPEYRVLLAVAQLEGEGGARVGVVAKRLAVTGSMVTMLANRLVRLGWVEKATNPLDSRHVLLRLTPVGNHVMVELQGAPQRVNDEMFRDLDVAEFHSLSQLVHRVVAGGERALALAASTGAPEGDQSEVPSRR
ncbi:MAG TPA: MarR family winged helix-turn-helix transcriptional regulator [Stellaceae bacterium]|nr:MarR family winged helix-turn-helix transcriptional regulator [Stellaceae bacterium]